MNLYTSYYCVKLHFKFQSHSLSMLPQLSFVCLVLLVSKSKYFHLLFKLRPSSLDFISFLSHVLYTLPRLSLVCLELLVLNAKIFFDTSHNFVKFHIVRRLHSLVCSLLTHLLTLFCSYLNRNNIFFFNIYFDCNCTIKTAYHLIVRLSPRPISTSQLHTLLHFHSLPIYHLFLMGSYYLRMGYLILRLASCLDAFSTYLIRT